MIGNYQTLFYICANITGDFSKEYKALFVSESNGCKYLWGMMIFRTFGRYEPHLVSLVRDKLNPNSLIEVHGISPRKLNVGIYCDKSELKNPNLQKSFVACHVRDYIFCHFDLARGDTAEAVTKKEDDYE